MYFFHSSSIWSDFPRLVAGVILVDGITKDVSVDSQIQIFTAMAGERLATSMEGHLPEIAAWRRAFSDMGLKPTQYRCAAEALLRRFRKDKAMPRIHPLVDLCNVISLAFAIPVAVFDVAKVVGGIEVRYASGSESFLDFSGNVEQPQRNEVIFADSSGRAHARRWTNRQSAYSAVREETQTVLIVAEALHESAPTDVERLTAAITGELVRAWSATPESRILDRPQSRFVF